MTSQVGDRPALLPGALNFSREDYQTSEREASTPEAIEEEEEEEAGTNGCAATLPTEVIQQIFRLVDPETFTSLILINRTWRKAADSPEIYAHHLTRCPSFAGSHNALAGPFKEEDLPKLKKGLLQEVKRNLFAPFLRPEQKTINLISITTSSSAAFPQGEGYEFIFSDRAQYCLALSSGRLIVINTAADTPEVTHELKVVRRPLSASILCDGSLLAVLAANHRVNLYDLTRDLVMFKRSIELNEIAHTITMTTGGEVLAAGSDSGVEVVSLVDKGPQPLKRLIKCDRVDSLSFSADGTMLLGTTQASRRPSTVILTAPYFTEYSEADMDRAELLSHLWTSQIIFPNSSRDCSHAALLPRSNDHDSNWTLAYDRVFESFRAVRTDDLRNGTTYFTGPEPNSTSSQNDENASKEERRRQRRSKNTFTPKSLPAITPRGELVAAPFLTSDIWLYGVPENLEHPGVHLGTDPPSSPDGSRPSSSLKRRSDVNRMPRWQVLVDKYRNVFAKGRKIASVTGATNMCWCSDDPESPNPRKRERLVIAAPGGVSDYTDLQEEELAVDGGRIVVLDFPLGSKGGTTSEITIELGTKEPQLLEEESIDLDEEIATARRRTLARQSGVSRLTISSVADILRPAGHGNAPPIPPLPEGPGFGLDRSGTDETQPSDSSVTGAQDSAEEGVSLEEAMEGLDGPYSQADPRSRGVVYRSAAAVEASRRRNPPNSAARGPDELRRTDGSEILPHESDADNWVPPPPAYGQHTDDVRRSIVTQGSKDTHDGAPVSPVTTTRAPTIRPVASIDSEEQASKANRRRSADVESSRWFRHEQNRSEPWTYGSPIAESSIQRSQSQRIGGLRDQQSPPLRALSGFAARSAANRTALRPPTSIFLSPEPQPTPKVSPLDPVPSEIDPPLPRAYFDGSSPEPRSPNRALAPRQQWPMTHEDGRPVVPPKDSPIPQNAASSSFDNYSAPPQHTIRRKRVAETSAYQSTAASLPTPGPSTMQQPPRKSPLAPIAKLGAVAASRVRQRSPPPTRPSVSRSMSARAPRAPRGVLEPSSNDELGPLPRSRRSLRFGRRRPKTMDPNALEANTTVIPGSSGVPNLPDMPSRRRTTAEPTSNHMQRGWERAPRPEETYQRPLYEVQTNVSSPSPRRRTTVRRAFGSMTRNPPVAPSGEPVAQPYSAAVPSERDRRKSRLEGGGKCIVM